MPKKKTNLVATQAAPSNTIPDDIANLLQELGIPDKEGQQIVYDFFYFLGIIVFQISQYEKEKELRKD